MKHRQKRALSLVLSGIMTASMLPSYLTQHSVPAAADDSTASDFVPDTDPTIDFDYAVNRNILSADDALKDLAKQNKNFKWVKGGTDKELLDAYNLYPWQHATNITISDWDEGSLRTYLESDAPEDKYVAISEDECDTWTDMDKDWEPVKITTDKVLDLNGHKLEIQYYSNKSNKHNDYGHVEDGDWISAYDERGRQNHENEDTHLAHCFEIEDGATLTIIDSSAWRGENKGEGTGSIEFDGYMVNHIECDGHPKAWDLDYYTTRDLFWVENGNLVVYGGHFQAGR